jgi:hypothetical protein
VKIEVNVSEVDLSSVIDSQWVVDSDGVEDQRSETLADRVANLVAVGVAREYPHLRQRVRDQMDAAIAAKVGPMIEEALSTAFQRTNPYGEAVGAPVTLREVIVDEARKLLQKPVDPYNRDKGTLSASLVRAEVDRAMRAELLDAVKAEKARVVALVRAKAADMIAESLKAVVSA